MAGDIQEPSQLVFHPFSVTRRVQTKRRQTIYEMAGIADMVGGARCRWYMVDGRHVKGGGKSVYLSRQRKLGKLIKINLVNITSLMVT